MDKENLRLEAIKTLKEISTNEKASIEKNIMKQLINSTYWKEAKSIGITISQGFEWDTRPIIELAWKEGKRVSAPKCLPKARKLNFYEFTSFNQLEVVYYNLLEPNEHETTYTDKENIDLIIVPGILFDHSGYRIGFGGGYYDRFLQDYKQHTLSLVSEKQLVEELPAESFDIPVQQIVTETQVLHTSS
ncbi:MAG TPA: 5-formyltetrahydrofolate cyclo-ligase [Virgibacillus sp.]|nr:5-formyltetrahydrofolate cyclo-ligase [Virgibacillus sp.]